MKTIKIIFILTIASLLLCSCDAGKKDVIKEIKYDLSIEYKVPISDIKVETIEYGTSVFTRNQFKVTINSKNISLYLVAKDGSGDGFTRIPIANK